MRRIYTLFLYLAIPLILVRLYWKGRGLAAYRKRIHERFMLISQPEKVDIWLHAVSLGEVIAATPLINELLARQFRVLITTMTPTGSQRVLEQFANRVQHQYLPYDLPFILRLFFKKYTPRIGVIMETELWPNLINQAQKAQVPVLIVNARISDRAFKRYQRFKFFFKPLLAKLSGILAQSKLDAERFMMLGAQALHVAAIGNLKFDLQTTVDESDIYQKIKYSIGVNRPVFIAASTHDNEEEQLLGRYNQLKSAIPHILLLIAPRHPERFQSVYRLSQQLGLNTALRSKSQDINHNTEVLILDSLGELRHFYKISDYAFVGGSLVPVGGHNLLEPIAAGVPVFCGPYIQNIRSICEELLKERAICIASNADNVISAMINLFHNETMRSQQIAKASEFLKLNQGCLKRYLQKIEELMAI